MKGMILGRPEKKNRPPFDPRKDIPPSKIDEIATRAYESTKDTNYSEAIKLLTPLLALMRATLPGVKLRLPEWMLAPGYLIEAAENDRSRSGGFNLLTLKSLVIAFPELRDKILIRREEIMGVIQSQMGHHSELDLGAQTFDAACLKILFPSESETLIPPELREFIRDMIQDIKSQGTMKTALAHKALGWNAAQLAGARIVAPDLITNQTFDPAVWNELRMMEPGGNLNYGNWSSYMLDLSILGAEDISVDERGLHLSWEKKKHIDSSEPVPKSLNF